MAEPSNRRSVAFFISPHGFGHAARACAVVQSLLRKFEHICFDLFTEVPEWFFKSSLAGGYTYHRFPSDVGLVQSTPFDENVEATLAAVKHLLLSRQQRIDDAVRQMRENQNTLVLCDISPLGVQAARAGGLPSILIENFTWEFIYAPYEAGLPEFTGINLLLKEMFSFADLRIQARPICQTAGGAYQVDPVARNPRIEPGEIRHRLQITGGTPIILVLTGGIETQNEGSEALKAFGDILFILPGASDQPRRDGNLIKLPHRHQFYTPDLVNASDAVIGKLGYSTVAEVYHAGVPFAYVPRENFAETPSMSAFVCREMKALKLSVADFYQGNWGSLPRRLLEIPRIEQNKPNGADQIADLISEWIRD